MQGLDLSSPPATMWATSTDDTVDMVITIPAITTMGDTEEDIELTNMATATASSMVWRTGMVAATITTLTTGMAATTRGDILDTSVRTEPWIIYQISGYPGPAQYLHENLNKDLISIRVLFLFTSQPAAWFYSAVNIKYWQTKTESDFNITNVGLAGSGIIRKTEEHLLAPNEIWNCLFNQKRIFWTFNNDYSDKEEGLDGYYYILFWIYIYMRTDSWYFYNVKTLLIGITFSIFLCNAIASNSRDKLGLWELVELHLLLSQIHWNIDGIRQ